MQQPPLKDHRLAEKKNVDIDPILNPVNSVPGNGVQRMNVLSKRSDGGREEHESCSAEQNVPRLAPFSRKRPRRECGRGMR